MSTKYRVVLGFDVHAVDVQSAEKEVSELITNATNLDDLKSDMVGFKVVEHANGMEEAKS